MIRYDTVSKLGWSVDIRTHGIRVVIEKLLSTDWDEGDNDDDGKSGNSRAVPGMIDEEDCVVRMPHDPRLLGRILIESTQDCFNWEFGDFRNVSLSSCYNIP